MSPDDLGHCTFRVQHVESRRNIVLDCCYMVLAFLAEFTGAPFATCTVPDGGR